MDYRNFDLWIDSGTGGVYPLRAASEPWGEARGVLALDPTQARNPGSVGKARRARDRPRLSDRSWGQVVPASLQRADRNTLSITSSQISPPFRRVSHHMDQSCASSAFASCSARARSALA